VAASGGAGLADVRPQRCVRARLSRRTARQNVGRPAGGEVVRSVVLRNPLGLHARPAADLARLVSGFDAAVTVDGVSASSVLAVMQLGAVGGQQIELSASGPEAAAAIAAVVAAVDGGFAERERGRIGVRCATLTVGRRAALAAVIDESTAGRGYPGVMTTSPPAPDGRRARAAARVVRKRPAKPQFAQTVLVLEACVVFFATLVAFGLRAAPPAVVWTAGGVLVGTLVLLSGWSGTRAATWRHSRAAGGRGRWRRRDDDVRGRGVFAVLVSSRCGSADGSTASGRSGTPNTPGRSVPEVWTCRPIGFRHDRRHWRNRRTDVR